MNSSSFMRKYLSIHLNSNLVHKYHDSIRSNINQFFSKFQWRTLNFIKTYQDSKFHIRIQDVYNYKRIEEIYSRQVPFMLQIYLSYYYKVTKKLQVCTKYISNNSKQSHKTALFLPCSQAQYHVAYSPFSSLVLAYKTAPKIQQKLSKKQVQPYCKTIVLYPKICPPIFLKICQD